jgi:hypothetical protein
MSKSFASVAKWISYIFGGLIAAFFLFMFSAYLIDDAIKNEWTALSPRAIIMFVFLGISLFGLILAYFKQLIGGILAVVGACAFILYESLGDGRIMPLTDGIFFYMLLMAGCFHINAWSMRKSAAKQS